MFVWGERGGEIERKTEGWSKMRELEFVKSFGLLMTEIGEGKTECLNVHI